MSETSINWQFYPKSEKIPEFLKVLTEIMERHEDKIKSPENNYSSNEVLEILRKDLEMIGFEVEKGKKKDEKIIIPVLYGLRGTKKKRFEADAYNKKTMTLLEVEGVACVANYLFLKDLFEACLMQNVDYLVIAMRNIRYEHSRNKDFRFVNNFLDTLYASNRLKLPLKGILIIGY